MGATLLAAVSLSTVLPPSATPAIPPGGSLTVHFATGAGGHSGSSDTYVDFGTITVEDGQAKFGTGFLAVYPITVPPSPAQCLLHLRLGEAAGGGWPDGDGDCTPGGAATMYVTGHGHEGVRRLVNNVPQNISIGGTVRFEISDSGDNDHVRAYFTVDADDPNAWAAWPAPDDLVFDLPITRGSVSSTCAAECDMALGSVSIAAPVHTSAGPFNTDVLQSFTTSSTFSGNCPCCEYRQYRTDYSTYFMFPWESRRQEDGVNFSFSTSCPGTTRYGHRDDPNCVNGDQYSPDRLSGCSYHNADGPGTRMPKHGDWTYMVEFEGAVAHPGGAGCHPDFERVRRTWDVCIHHNASTGAYEDCSLVGAQENGIASKRVSSTATNTTLLGCSSAPVLGLSVEKEIRVCARMRSDTLALTVEGYTSTYDLDSLEARAAALSVSGDGLDTLAAMPPFRFETQTDPKWAAMFFFKAPAVLADSIAVHLDGLEVPILVSVSTHDATVGIAPVAAGSGNWLVVPRQNPARGFVSFSCRVGNTGSCHLSLYDVSGRKIRDLFEGRLEAGVHAVQWDGRLNSGDPAPAGVYLARLAGAGGAAASRIVFLH